VAAEELQASFTGEEPRLGVFILPHAVAKVFALGRRQKPRDSASSDDGAASCATQSRKGRKPEAKKRTTKKPAARRQQAKSQAAAAGSGGGDYVPSLEFDKGNNTDDDLPPGFSFDWEAYTAVWGDTPFEDAVTALFAEYAVLYARVARWTTCYAPPPRTLDEASAIAKHAATFVKEYVRPILGDVNTPKIHELLRHIMGAIRMHGNLRNCNTRGNEAGHKIDKLFYRRTNRVIKTFTAQTARQSQGTQAVLARLAEEDAEAIRCDKVRRQRRSQKRGGNLTSMTKRSVHKVPRIAVGGLSQRPGLGRLASVLGIDANDKLPVLGEVKFLAELDCGTRLRQTLRASVNYRRKGAWFDAVIYTVAGEQPVVDEGGTAIQPLHYGEVRALLLYKEEDVAVVCNMETVDAEERCPLAERECTRIKWAVPAPEDGDWSVTAVPISRVRRVIHVVPDFDDLSTRRGVKAMPARYTASGEQRRAMRYYENAFFPWD